MGLDDSTVGEWLLGGMNSELQNAWGASCDKYINITALANWAIEKETKLATVRPIQGKQTPWHPQGQARFQETPTEHINLEQRPKKGKLWT